MPGGYAVGGSVRKTVMAAALILALLLLTLLIYRQTTAQPSITFTRDTDGNEIWETYRLTSHRVKVIQDQMLLWESPAEWKVTNLVVADADHDGQEEMLMVLWKRGSFGTSRPMWMDEPDNEYSNHLFMYRLAAGKMKPVWCSSAIEYPIHDLQVDDRDGDGRLELLVTEGPPAGALYSIRKLFYQNHTVWQWQEWGFVKVNEGKQ